MLSAMVCTAAGVQEAAAATGSALELSPSVDERRKGWNVHVKNVRIKLVEILFRSHHLQINVARTKHQHEKQ